MKPGYLSIETHRDRPGLVRLIITETAPDTGATRQDPLRIRHIVQFDDSEAALMHTHEILKRRLLDPDAHLYRATFERAIGAVESLALRHRRVYLDTELPAQSSAAIEGWTIRFRNQRRRRERLFETLGYIGLGLLLFNLLFLSFR